MAENKTEEPTANKLRKSREEGQVVRSPEVNAVLTAVASLSALTVMGDWMMRNIASSVTMALKQLATGAWKESGDWALELGWSAVWTCLPLILVIWLSGGLAAWVQVGGLLNLKAVSPKLGNINPIAGIKRIFSSRTLWQMGRDVLKLLCLVGVIAVIATDLLKPLLQARGYPLWQQLVVAWHGVSRLFWACLFPLGALAALDFMMQRHFYLREQRMTIDEVRRDHKEQEGDPAIKGLRRQLAREAVNSSSLPQGLHQASVLVTNPTHVAVALRYALDTPLPIVVAKGEDLQAHALRQEALAQGLAVVEDVVLARTLYQLPLFSAIKSEQFEAVAAVLIWVAEVELAQRQGNADGGRS